MVRGKETNLRPVNRKGWFRPYIAGTWQLYAMMLIPIIYIICFKYKPMLGIVMAFKKYTPLEGPPASCGRPFFHSSQPIHQPRKEGDTA